MSKFNFAHLLGRSASVAEDDEDEKEKKSKAKKAEDDDEKKKDPDAAEDDDSDPDASEDDEEDKEKEPKGKKAKAEDDDDDEDDKKESPDVKKGRKAERSRCKEIFASEHATGRPELAAALAFSTPMSAKAAIEFMASQGPAASIRPARASLSERMVSVVNPNVGVDISRAEAGTPAAAAQQMTSLYNSAKGKK